MYISFVTRKLLKDFAQQINDENFEELFIEAHLRDFNCVEIRELHDVLLGAKIFDSTEVRKKLLWEEVKSSLKVAESHQDDPYMKDKYLVQFIIAYLGTRFGFTVDEVVELMLTNQESLGIALEPHIIPGRSSIENYIILFD